MALPDTDAAVQGLVDFVDASPSPFHAVLTASRLLGDDGYSRGRRDRAVPAEPGRYLPRPGRLAGGVVDAGPPASSGVGRSGSSARTPTARTCGSSRAPTRPAPAGSCSASSPTAGRCWRPGWTATSACRDAWRSAAANGVEARLFLADEPLLRVAQLAIHLSEPPKTTLTLNVQQHLAPIWGLGALPGDFRAWLGERVDAGAEDVLGVGRHDPRRRALAADRPQRRAGRRARGWTTR